VKLCTWCKTEQPHSEFRADKRRKDGLRNECRSCARAYAARWARKNYTPQRAAKGKYGLSPEVYDFLMKAQDQRCAICYEPFDRSQHSKRPCVDHDHETGRIRGLLCRQCNVGIGNLRDDPDILYAAMRYLQSRSGTAMTFPGRAAA